MKGEVQQHDSSDKAKNVPEHSRRISSDGQGRLCRAIALVMS